MHETKKLTSKKQKGWVFYGCYSVAAAVLFRMQGASGGGGGGGGHLSKRVAVTWLR